MIREFRQRTERLAHRCLISGLHQASVLRVAQQYRSAAGTEQDIMAHLKPFTDAYQKLHEAIKNGQDRKLPGTHSVVLSWAHNPWVYVINHGYKIVDAVLSTRSIPPRNAKDIEMAYRLFSTSRRLPKDIYKWWEKNQKRLDIVVEATKWPAKKEGSDELFTVGSFRVHNTIGATGKALEQIKSLVSLAEKAARKNPVPGFARTIYGDIYVVSRITHAHHAAWYNPGDDSIYLRMVRETDKRAAQSFLHELGHRYWSKYASAAQKQEWQKHHIDVEGKDVDVVMPKVGDEAPVKYTGQKGPAIFTKEDGGIYHFKVNIKGVERTGTVTKHDIFKFKQSVQRAEQNFPTTYASTSFEEHFCDALMLYAFGDLPTEHKAEFVRIWG